MPVTIVVGAQWGDEGKGKIVDFYARDADVVARFQGGNNAGHTVKVGEETFKFHLLPSGVVNDKAVNVIANGLVVDPKVLLDELKDLRGRGKDAHLRVSDRAHVIMPYHRELDGAREDAARAGEAIGTTRRGIGPAYADKVARVGIRVSDLVDAERLRARVASALPEKNLLLEHYGKRTFTVDEIVDEYAAYGKAIAPLVTDTVAFLHDCVDKGANVVLEGAQGSFLDVDHGTFPFVTSSTTTAGGACAGSGLPPTLIDDVVGVVKAYTTRVGEGPFVAELPRDEGPGEHLGTVGHEFGTTTGRARRVGWLDLVLLRRACRVNGFTAIALTKLDVLGDLDDVQYVDAYDVDGTHHKEPPADPDALARAKPVTKPLPRFDALTPAQVAHAAKDGARTLPDGARAVIELIERELEVPVILVGLGPSREATIDRRLERS